MKRHSFRRDGGSRRVLSEMTSIIFEETRQKFQFFRRSLSGEYRLTRVFGCKGIGWPFISFWDLLQLPKWVVEAWVFSIEDIEFDAALETVKLVFENVVVRAMLSILAGVLPWFSWWFDQCWWISLEASSETSIAFLIIKPYPLLGGLLRWYLKSCFSEKEAET